MIDDDDMLLNVISKDSKKQLQNNFNANMRPSSPENKKLNKTDIKKMKYTAKLKYNRSKAKNQ